jgi:hypothetical protein
VLVMISLLMRKHGVNNRPATMRTRESNGAGACVQQEASGHTHGAAWVSTTLVARWPLVGFSALWGGPRGCIVSVYVPTAIGGVVLAVRLHLQHQGITTQPTAP